MPTHLSAFVLTTWLLAMLPGAGQALMVRQTLHGGLRAAWATIGGTCSGLLLWTIGAAAGLSAILLANPHAGSSAEVGPWSPDPRSTAGCRWPRAAGYCAWAQRSPLASDPPRPECVPDEPGAARCAVTAHRQPSRA